MALTAIEEWLNKARPETRRPRETGEKPSSWQDDDEATLADDAWQLDGLVSQLRANCGTTLSQLQAFRLKLTRREQVGRRDTPDGLLPQIDSTLSLAR